MFFFGKMLGYRDFSKKEEIKKDIAEKEGLSKEVVDRVQGFTFFESERQKTWLIASPNYLYCVLDDIKANNFEVRWKMSKEELQRDIHSNSDFLKITPHYREKSGRVDFGRLHRGWLYSKDIFPATEEFKSDFLNLILSTGLTRI